VALIKLKTKLKSLKYGGDRPGGGSSNQPYVTREIPKGDLPAKAGPDFLLRGGFLAPVAAARDVSRISQMLVDTKSPNGFEFIAKQNILSRTSVKTEASNGPAYGGSALNQGIYNPASTIAQVGVQGWTPIHLNLFGVDPTGLSPLSIIKYEDLINDQLGRGGYKIKSEEGNRLLNILDNITNNTSSNNFNFEGINLNVGNSVLEYGGGPGSILGVGTTKIRFADQKALYKGQAPLNDQNNFLTWTYQDFANITGSTPGKTGGIIDFRKTIINNNPEELSLNPTLLS
jgi:hypothetical protein